MIDILFIDERTVNRVQFESRDNNPIDNGM